MKATATAGEKPKLTLGQRLHTQAVLMSANGKNVKGPSRETVACTYISLQQPQFRKASFQTIKTPREDRLITRTRWWVRGCGEDREGAEGSNRFSCLTATAQPHAEKPAAARGPDRDLKLERERLPLYLSPPADRVFACNFFS